MKRIKSKIGTEKIYDNLYLVNYEVQMRIPRTIFSDSTCSLKLLREDIQTTDKLESNTIIQLQNLIVFIEKFSEGEVRAFRSLQGQILQILLPEPPRTQSAW